MEESQPTTAAPPRDDFTLGIWVGMVGGIGIGMLAATFFLLMVRR